MDNKYAELINKIRITGCYIDKLAKIENEMVEDIEANILEPIVKDIVEKCIDDINGIYIQQAINNKTIVDKSTLQVDYDGGNNNE